MGLDVLVVDYLWVGLHVLVVEHLQVSLKVIGYLLQVGFYVDLCLLYFSLYLASLDIHRLRWFVVYLFTFLLITLNRSLWGLNSAKPRQNDMTCRKEKQE